jgi:maltooligosyltrehalose trehalohydrolase
VIDHENPLESKVRLESCPKAGGVHFQVWAPAARTVEVVWERSGTEAAVVFLSRAEHGYFRGMVLQMQAGHRYRYRVDGAGPFPDPASRYQPDGVHGPSEVVDAGRFSWSDAAWRGIALEDAVIYELHVGTFSEFGTFAAVTERLPQMVDLGVTAIELMPVADFPGQRNWGYDGVSLFAPARCYGRPDDLRRLVDEAHRLGLAVLLDVVYNHLGPDGNYLPTFSPHYFSNRHQNACSPGKESCPRCPTTLVPRPRRVPGGSRQVRLRRGSSGGWPESWSRSCRPDPAGTEPRHDDEAIPKVFL